MELLALVLLTAAMLGIGVLAEKEVSGNRGRSRFPSPRTLPVVDQE